MWLGAKFTLLSDSLFKSLFRFRFRYDVFISYARSDGKDYALKLRDQLRQLDFSCFLDYDELPAGNSLSNTLKRALGKSATLVVVGTQRAIKSRYVELEIAEFGKTGRAIVPIDIDGSLAEVPWQIVKERDIVWIDEVQSALAKGLPSPNVADSIDKLFKYTRRNSRVRGQVLATMTLFILVVIVSLFMIQQKVKAANNASAEATRQKIEAQNQKKVADDATSKATLAERSANTALAKATKAEKAASDATREAKKQEGIALANAETAKKQQLIAEERTNYLRAQQMGVQAAIDIDQGNDVERSLLLSVESLKRALTPDSAIAWSRGMELLPQTQAVTFSKAQDNVTAIAYSPDGRFFAQGTGDGTVTFFRTEKTAEAVERRLQSKIKVISFGEDWVAAASVNEFKMWDLNKFEEIRSSKTLNSFYGEATIAFSPDGRYVASGDSGGATLRVVDTIKGSTVIDMPIKNLSYLLNVDFSPNGKWLAIASHYFEPNEKGQGRSEANSFAQGRLMLLSVANFDKGAERATDPVASVTLNDPIDRATFGPLGEHLASESEDGFVTIWQVSEENEYPVLSRVTSQKTRIKGWQNGMVVGGVLQVFSPDELYIASLGSIWEVSSGKEVARIAATEIAFSPAGQFATIGGQVHFWKTMFGSEARRLSYIDKSTGNDPNALAVSPNGAWLVTGDQNGVHVFSTTSWAETIWLSRGEQIVKLTFNSNGRWLVATGQDKVRVIDTQAWTERVFKQPFSGYPEALGFSPDGRWFVRAAAQSVSLFAVGTWVERRIGIPKDGGRVAISPDSRRLSVVVLGEEPGQGGLAPLGSTRKTLPPNEVFIWETANGNPVACKEDKETKTADEPGVQRTICSQVQGVRQSVSLAEVNKWKQPLEFNVIARTSPDGLWTVSHEDGIELTFNEGNTGRQVAKLMQSTPPNLWTFTTDSRWLVLAGGGTLRVWPLRSTNMIDAACERLRRHELTDDEWRFSEARIQPCSSRPKPAIVERMLDRVTWRGYVHAPDLEANLFW